MDLSCFICQDTLLLILLGLTVISVVLWLFTRKKRSKKLKSVRIIVEHGFKPTSVVVEQGKTVELVFVRTDPTDCFDEIIIPNFQIREKLPLNEKVSVEITPRHFGEFIFHCKKNDHNGVIEVQ